MATREELIAQGKTPEQIDAAVVNKNSQAIAQKLGQTYDQASGQFNVAPIQPVVSPIEPTPLATPAPTAPLTQEQMLTPTTEIAQPQPVQQPQAITPPKSTEQAPTAQKTGKEAVPVDYNKSEGREVDINNNLSSITATNTALLTDRAKYDKAFGYATADEGKKAMLDSFFNEKNKQLSSPEFLFNQLATGQPVNDAIKQTPEFKIANQRLENLRQYSSYNSNQFASALSSGTLLPGTQTYNDLLRDPKLKANIDKANILNQTNGNKVDTTAAVKNTMEDIIVSSPLGQALKDGFISGEEANQLTSSPEIKAKEEKLSALQNDVTTKQNMYDNIRVETERELKGKDVTNVAKEALIASRQRDLLGPLNLSIGLYNNTLGQVADLKKTSAELFDKNFALYKEEKAAKEGIAKEARQFEQQKELSRFEARLGIETNQAEFEQKLKQQATLASDPYTAISSVMDQYAKLGIPFSQGISTKVADAEKFIAAGGTIGQYVDKMIKDVQNKPEWKAIGEIRELELKKQRMELEGSDKIKPMVVGKDSFIYDPVTKTFRSPTAGVTNKTETSTLLLTPEGIGNFTTQRKNPAGEMSTDVQCGMLVNDWYKSVTGQSAGIGNTYNDKLGAIKKIGLVDSPEVGSIFVSNPLKNSVGHTGIVQQVNSDGSILVREANLEGSDFGGPAVTSRYSKKQADEMMFAKSPTIQSSSINPTDIDIYNSLTATAKKKMQDDPNYRNFIQTKQNVMEDENASIFDVMKFSQGGKDMGEERLKSLGKFSQGLSQIGELTKSIKNVETGPIQGLIASYNPYDPNAQALLAEINSIIPNIARGVYGEVGVLTDADVQNYAKTLPNIRSTEDTNNLVLAMTLKTMLNGFKSQIQIDGSAGRDVSGFAGTVKQYESKINKLMGEIENKKPAIINSSSSDEEIRNYLNQP